MRRDLGALSQSLFDILVVGGGIHGAAILQEGTRRGFKTALIEQGDFGQATSANSLKILHGGLRYLQQADLRRIRQSVIARRKFMEFAPHLVRPQPFLIPIYGHGLKGREAMAAALIVSDLLSWDRNRHLPKDSVLPPGRIVSRKECLNRLPDIEGQGLTGGALWYDVLVQHTERLTLECILDASEKGATAANYVRAEKLLVEKGTVRGISANELFSLTEFPVRARMVVNASGPWLKELLQPWPQTPEPPLNWVKGLNLVVRKPLFRELGVGLREIRKTPAGRGSRFLFFVPWHGQMMIGTAYNRYAGKPDRCRLEGREVAEFLEEINAVYPPARLRLDDVSLFHFGLQPLSEGQDERNAHPEPDRHSAIIDHEALNQVKGLISVKSTKFTTAPLLAEKVLDLITAKGSPPVGGALQIQDVPAEDPPLTEEELAGLTGKDRTVPIRLLADHFRENYGPRRRALHPFAGDQESPQLISRDPLLTAAEVRYGIREEMALKLSDMVFRRTSLAQAGCPTRDSLQKVAEIMAGELGWDEIRKKREIEEIFRAYQPLKEKG